MFETTDETFQLVRCKRCGLLYLNPRPALDDLGRYYRDDYAPFARRGISARAKSLTFRREVAELWPMLAPPSRVIDIGCATGELLHAVQARGNPNVLGIEPSSGAAAIARQRWRLEVLTGTLEAAELPAASIDVALLSHTAEHLPSPSTTFAELNRVLKPGGTVVLWVPNAASFAAQLLGDWWIGYDAPRHFYAYTPATLAQLLQRQSFAIRSIHHEWIGLEWSWALRLWVRDRWPNSPLNPALAALHPLLTAAFTPITAFSAVARRGGRMRIIARKVR
jgi:SAM-dependent methyltransferase